VSEPVSILADHLQDQYAESRRLWREHYLEWLAARELPGKPNTSGDHAQDAHDGQT